ncbi:MAG: ATP-binding protein [Salinirussus sp.]
MVGLTAIGQVVATGAGVALLWLAYRTYTEVDKPAARSFGVLLSILGITALCAGATAHTGTPYKLVWLYTGLAIPIALAFFAFDYYGLNLLSTRTQAAVAVAPAAAGALGGTLIILGTPSMSPGPAAPVDVLATLPAVGIDLATTLNQVGLFYTTAVMVLAVALVLRTVYRYEHLDARLVPVISVIGVWPWLGNMFIPELSAAFTPGTGVVAVAGGYAVSAGLAALALGPLELLKSSPMAGNVGPEIVLDSMDDAVIVVDDGGRVLRLNAVAVGTFGTTEPEAAGGPVEAVVGHSLDALDRDETVAVDTVDGIRQFEVTRSTVTDRTGEDRGHAIVLRDVTQRRTREQRLDVLNRVLRHNLRNDANSIIGFAELVDESGDSDSYTDRIVDTTRDLVDVAERAREIHRMMTAPTEGGPTDVSPVVESIAEEISAEYPAVEVTTAIPDEACAAVDPTTIEVIVRNLVENGAEHNDADEPIVVVSADNDGESVRIAVADNGPGIPDHERSVLEAGSEDQLHHGSGLGLWAAHWGVTTTGGTLSFSENDPRGSIVTATLPDARDGTPTRSDAAIPESDPESDRESTPLHAIE